MARIFYKVPYVFFVQGNGFFSLPFCEIHSLFHCIIFAYMHCRFLIFPAFVRIFFTKIRIDFYESGNSHCYEAQEHGNNKEHLVAKLHL